MDADDQPGGAHDPDVFAWIEVLASPFLYQMAEVVHDASDGLLGDNGYGDPAWNALTLAESIATQLPRDLNFDGDVRKKPNAKYCVVTFPGAYSGDFGLFLDSNDPNTCCACVFQADGATSQFLGPPMVSVKGKHAGEHWTIVGHPEGKSCVDSCWCTELEGAGTVDENGQQVGELSDKMGGMRPRGMVTGEYISPKNGTNKYSTKSL